jgi:PAS domain S-box-containing protein
MDYDHAVGDIYELAFESALAGIAIADLEGELRRVNPAFIDMWGYDNEDEIVGRPVTEFWADPDTAQAVATEVVETGEWEGELLAEHTDGSTFHVHTAASIVRNDDDEPVYIMSSFVDISERISKQRALQQKNEQLEEFASIISHDLRNPLNVALSRVELAQRERESESGHLGEAVAALERTEAIITDVLEKTRHGAGVDEFESLNLSATIETCWRQVPTAQATLVCETTQRIEADEGRLKQLLENLLRNAVEHAGSEVTVTIDDLKNGFSVADDGPGIPNDERDAVFETGYSTTDDGTGFGLNIVQEIVTAHGWEITVTDSESGGAQFEITGVEIVAE